MLIVWPTFTLEQRSYNVSRIQGRDAAPRNRAQLRADGWKVFEIWECETRDPERLSKRLQTIVEYLTRSDAVNERIAGVE